MKSKNSLNNPVKTKFIPRVLSALWAVSFLLLGNMSNAQTLQLQYTFADGPGTTTASGGALPVPLNLISNGAPFDLHGAANSGVQGQGFSLNLSHNPISGNSGAQAFALASNNTALATLGTVSDFSASVWFKFTHLTTNLVNNSTRFFVLAPNGVNDNGNANSIGLDISVGNAAVTFPQNAINVLVGSSAATIPPIYYNFPTNEWLFCAFTYSSASGLISVYFGSEASPAQLLATRLIPAGTSFNLVGTGGGANLSIGNRPSGGRDFPGWIDDFRFYTGAASASFVEGIRQSATPIVVSNLNPDGSVLLDGTNTLTFTASSVNGINTSNIKVRVNGTDVSPSLSFSGSSTSVNVTYTNLPVNSTLLQQTNLNGVGVSILVMDNSGITTSNAYVYDAFSPTNFTWECEDYDFGGGLFIVDPVISFLGANTNTYYQETNPYVSLVDANDNGNIAGPSRLYRDLLGNVETEYSAGSGNNGGNSIGELTREVVWQAFAQTNIAGEVNVGYFDGGTGIGLPNWMNYTRFYPAGEYNVYLRDADGGGTLSASFDLVTNDWGTTNEMISHIGNFNFVNTGGWDSFAWIPLRDNSGNLIRLTLNGNTNTFRLTAGPGGGGNVNFFLLTPANTNLPVISSIYPNGTNMFQPSPTLSFNASSPVGVNISTNSITVVLTATSLLGKSSTNTLTATSGLSFSGTTTNWAVTAPLSSNFLYTASISIIDANGSSASTSVTFDTLAPAYTWEAPDYDYDGGLFIADPIPVDGYMGLSGESTVDFFFPSTAAPANNYRDSQITGVETDGDAPQRLQFLTNSPAPQPYDMGYYNAGNWLNYTRNFPAGEYNVYARMADGSTSGGSVVASVVTSGWGTSTQTTNVLGSFTLPPTGGWQTYTWEPLRDANGNLVKFSGGTTNTLKMTSEGSQNVFFYALFAANTNLPVLSSLYPNGTNFSQTTNTFAFNIASPAGVSSNSVVVTVNGNVVSNLVFSGTVNNWAVTYPHLQPNSSYMITVVVTDANGNSSTASVMFDTMNPNNYTWEAEDFDYGGGLFIDNPQTNLYNGLSALVSADAFQVNFAGTYVYRPDGEDTEINGDMLRPQYLDPTNPQHDYSIGFFSDGAWTSYTRHYPAGSYNVYIRCATGGGTPTDATLSEVTTNWGTTAQETNMLGTFTVPNTGGWENYFYVPLRDANGNLVALNFNGSTNTLQLGRPVDNPTSPDLNVNFLMLTPVFSANAAHTGTNIVVSFQTMSGFNYQVLYKTNLTDPTWLPLGSVLPGNNSSQSVSDPTTSATRFYRVQIQ